MEIFWENKKIATTPMHLRSTHLRPDLELGFWEGKGGRGEGSCSAANALPLHRIWEGREGGEGAGGRGRGLLRRRRVCAASSAAGAVSSTPASSSARLWPVQMPCLVEGDGEEKKGREKERSGEKSEGEGEGEARAVKIKFKSVLTFCRRNHLRFRMQKLFFSNKNKSIFPSGSLRGPSKKVYFRKRTTVSPPIAIFVCGRLAPRGLPA